MISKFRYISFYVVGIMLILSSLMKAVDLVSFSTKIGEYAYALGIKCPYSVYDVAAMIIVFIELSLGIIIIRGIYTRIIYFLTFIFILFFTLLTLYIALNDSILECGCFGNILEFTMWQSFVKNIIFLFLIIISYEKKLFRKRVYGIQIIVVTIIVFLFCISNIIAQPLFDVKKYGVGDSLSNVCEIESIDNGNLKMGSYNGIIRNFIEVDYHQIESLIDVLNDFKMASNEPMIILTASPLSVVKDLQSDVIIGRCDNSDLSNIISGNVGIITISNNIITSKWQKDNLGLRSWPKIIDNKIYDCLWIRILQMTIWVIIGIIIVSSIIHNYSKNEVAENREK